MKHMEALPEGYWRLEPPRLTTIRPTRPAVCPPQESAGTADGSPSCRILDFAIAPQFRVFRIRYHDVREFLFRLLPAPDRRAARQSIWMGAILFVQTVGGVVQVSLSARMLGAEGFGVLAIMIAVNALCFGLLSMPGQDAITTYVSRGVVEGRHREAGAVLRFALLAALVARRRLIRDCGYYCFHAGGLIGLDSEHVTPFAIFGLTGLCRATYRENLAILRLADRLPLGLVVASTSALARVVVLVIGWYSGAGMLSVVTAYVVGAAVEGAGMLVAGAVSVSRLGVAGVFKSLSIRIPRDVVSFQIASFWRSSVQAVVTQIDVILISQLTTTTQLGFFQAARQIVEATRRPFLQIEAAVQVEYSKQWFGSNGDAVRGLARRFTLLTVVIGAAGYGTIALIPDTLIGAVLGSAYKEGVQALVFLALGAFAFSTIAASMCCRQPPVEACQRWSLSLLRWPLRS